MPYVIKNLVSTRRDPNHRPNRGGRHKTPGIRRAYARLTIGNRSVKVGKQISISDTIYEKFKTKIDALAKSGIIALTKTGSAKTAWEPEPLYAPAPPAPEPTPPPAEEKAEEPKRGVVEIDMAPEPEPEPEPEVIEAAAEPEEAEEAPKAKAGKKRSRRKKKGD
jgi:hypothetical protein